MRSPSFVILAAALAWVAACSSKAPSSVPDDVAVETTASEPIDGWAGPSDTESADSPDEPADVEEDPEVGADAPLDSTSIPDSAADTGAADTGPAPPNGWLPEYGAFRSGDEVTVRVRSVHATRVEAWFYDQASGAPATHTIVLDREDDSDVWAGSASIPEASLYYGLRVWGPNWEYVPEWEPGTDAGFISDVDAEGNRFNPNKLVLDPYALEMSHDPLTPAFDSWWEYQTGPEHRAIDSAWNAPKGIVFDPRPAGSRPGPLLRPMAGEIVYEVHVRGLTMNDPNVPEELRGTYAGAAFRAPYLAELGITAVEFLPIHETQNARNDVFEGTDGDNYWGYASLSYFAPDRRYAHDQSPGGPTRELIEMVDAFHDVGIKVYVDVVYNHTGEGGAGGEAGEYSSLLSWRGVDNAEWYHSVRGTDYRNDNGVGPNLRFTAPLVQDGIIDSLRYYVEVIGVDGFRFDLASVLGNECTADCFRFNPNLLITRIRDEFARDPNTFEGVDLIAEPWGTSDGTYQVGGFPSGWHVWNDRYRVAIRGALNPPDAPTTPRELRERIVGSPDLFWDNQLGPSTGVSYVVSHDGFSLGDLFRCNEKVNDQPWPWGPSDGGSDFNQGWDHDGDEEAQVQAARNALTVATLSHGIPMITGGDEFLRTQRCNNNVYNVDSIANWLNWPEADAYADFQTFTRRMFTFRNSEPALGRVPFNSGEDTDGDGLPGIAWYDQWGNTPGDGYWDNPWEPFLIWRIDADQDVQSSSGTRSILVVWNRGDDLTEVQLPAPADGHTWYRVADTDAWMEFDANSHELDAFPLMPDSNTYGTHPDSVVVLVER